MIARNTALVSHRVDCYLNYEEEGALVLGMDFKIVVFVPYASTMDVLFGVPMRC